MKLTKKLLCLGFLLVLVLVPLLTAYGVLTNPTGWSAQENRALAGKPEVSAAALWTGDTAAQTEGFLKDHLYKRNAILKFGVWFQMRVLHRPVVEDVVLGSEVLLPVAEIADYRVGKLEKRADAMAESLAAIQAATEDAGGQFCYVLVPEQRSALLDYYPDWMENRAAQYDATRAAFTAAMEAHGVPLLDLTETYRAVDDLTEYYSTVDHHYTLKGAALAYQTVCDALELPFVQPDIQVTAQAFLGTYNRKLYGLSPVSEQFQSDFSESIPYSRWDNGERTDRPMIDASGAEAYYTAYMGGDMGETIVQTGRPELGKILIVGDSFTNAFETLCYRSFGEMRSLDFRHYSETSLTEYIRDYQPDVVLVMRDDLTCLNTGGNGTLE